MGYFLVTFFAFGITAVVADVKFQMYTEPNWQGTWLEFAMQNECTDIIPEFNDLGNSIRIEGNGCALLCEHYGCQGNCIKMEDNAEGESDFSRVDFASKVSSVKDCYARAGASDEPTNIPGTSLFTNVWYQINLKNKGLLTWAYAKVNGDGHHVQIVYSSGADEFQKGQRYYDDTEWMILPSEVPGYYLLENRKLPNAVITWQGKSPSGKWVVGIDGKANAPEYLEGGGYREDALWRFEPDSADSSFFNIYNKRFPNNGLMTWSTADVTTGKKYVQIYSEGNVKEEWKHDPDYLWSFTPSSANENAIPGTSLFTNIWYQINLKSQGLLTWSYQKVNEDGYHVDIVWKAFSGYSEFEKGGKYYADTQWMIVKSEESGYYNLMNKGLPNAVFTWQGKSTSGKWVVLIDGKASDPAYLAGGGYREDALWKIEPKSGDYYNLFNKRFPNNGIMTYSNQDFTNGKKFVQIYSDGDVKAEWKNDNDYLWSFTPV